MSQCLRVGDEPFAIQAQNVRNVPELELVTHPGIHHNSLQDMRVVVEAHYVHLECTAPYPVDKRPAIVSVVRKRNQSVSGSNVNVDRRAA